MRSRKLLVACLAAATVSAGLLAAPTVAGAKAGSNVSVLAKKPKCNDTFTNDAGGYGWSVSGNWSAGLPVSTTFACIPSSIKQPVVFASYSGSILGLKATNKAGVSFNNGSLTLTTDPSEIKDIATGNAQLTVNSGVTLSLKGKKGNLGQDAFDLNGPGTVLIPAGQTVNMGNAQIQQGLQVINQGTITGTGAGACQDSAANPAELENEAAMDLSTSGGWGGGTFCTTNGGNFINSGTVTISGASTNVAMTGYATWENSGSVTVASGDELTLPGTTATNNGSINTAGEVAFSGNPTLPSSSVLGIVLNSGSNGTAVASGTFTLNGTLAITTSADPTLNTPITVAEAGTVTGTFSGNFSAFTVNGQSGLCVPGDSGVGFVQNFTTIDFIPAMTLTAESGQPGC